MNIQDIINRKKEVRIVDSTYIPADDTREMIGGEFEVRQEYYYEGIVSVWNKDKSDHFIFNRSDVRELTPLSFNGKRIAILDEVKMYSVWELVYGYGFYDGEWYLKTVKDNDFENGCSSYAESEVEDHRTGQDEVQKAIKLLTDKGMIKDGKVITI